jgi:hypothetical protein
VPESRELWLYYRQVTSDNVILLTRSADGAHWSPSVEVVRAPSHQLVSPAVVRRGPRDWLMWSVNGGPIGCRATGTTVELRRSEDGVAWGAPATVTLDQPGYSVWHIDVQWIASRREYWALYNVKTPDNCNSGAVFLATSADGATWTTYPAPVLRRGAIAPFRDNVYRSTFEYRPVSDLVTIWYSGARWDGSNYVWSAAVERRDRAALFAEIASPPLAMDAPRGARRDDLANRREWPPDVPLLDERSAP